MEKNLSEEPKKKKKHPQWVFHEIKIESLVTFEPTNMCHLLQSYYYDGFDFGILLSKFVVSKKTLLEFTKQVVDGFVGSGADEKSVCYQAHSILESLNPISDDRGIEVQYWKKSLAEINAKPGEMKDFSALMQLFLTCFPHLFVNEESQMVMLEKMEPLPETEEEKTAKMREAMCNRWAEITTVPAKIRTTGSFVLPDSKSMPHVWLDVNTMSETGKKVSLVSSKWPSREWGEINIEFIEQIPREDTQYFAGNLIRVTQLCFDARFPEGPARQWVHGNSITITKRVFSDTKQTVTVTNAWKGLNFFILITRNGKTTPTLHYNNGERDVIEECVYFIHEVNLKS